MIDRTGAVALHRLLREDKPNDKPLCGECDYFWKGAYPDSPCPRNKEEGWHIDSRETACDEWKLYERGEECLQQLNAS